MAILKLDIDKKQAQAIQTYQKLPKQAQGILQILSVLYEPVDDRTFAREFINSPLLDEEDGSPINLSKFNRTLTDLIRKKLIIKTRRKYICCSPLIVEVATRDTVNAGTFDHLVKVTNRFLPLPKSNFGRPPYFRSQDQAIRQARLYLYQNEHTELMKLLVPDNGYWYGSSVELPTFCFEVIGNPLDLEWCKKLPDFLLHLVLSLQIRPGLLAMLPIEQPWQVLKTLWEEDAGISQGQLGVLVTEVLIWFGEFERAAQALNITKEHLETDELPWAWARQGMLALLQGDTEEALVHYDAAYRKAKKTATNRQSWFATPATLFYSIALMKAGTGQHLATANTLLDQALKQPPTPFTSSYAYLFQLVRRQQGLLPAHVPLTQVPQGQEPGQEEGLMALHQLVESLSLYWTSDREKYPQLKRSLTGLIDRAMAVDMEWVAAEAAALLERCGGQSSALNADAWWQARGGTPLVEAIAVKEPWELSLQALANLDMGGVGAAPVAEKRLVWFVTYTNPRVWTIQPKEQKISVKGHWSRGRAIALKRLAENDADLDYLTPQDRQVCAFIEQEISDSDYYYYRGSSSYEFADGAIAALVGHPLVFWDDSKLTRIEVVGGEPELLVQEQPGDRLRLQLSPPLNTEGSVVVVKETPTRLKVVALSDRHHHIATIIGPDNCLEVPMAAKERVLTAISAVSGIVTVHSDIGGEAADAETVPAVPLPHIHLFPAGNGLRVTILVRPFGQAGPYYSPGSGGAVVLGEVDGQRLQTHRELATERDLADGVVRACPPLVRNPDTHYEWDLDDLEDCLELLSALQTLGDQAIVEWPEGETLRLRHGANSSNFQLRVERQRDWFAASGTLQLSEDQVMDMQQLMRLLSQTPSRFIPLGDGQFLELTASFRRRLDELRAFSENHGDGVRFHPLVAPALEDFMDEVGDIKADKAWKTHLKKMKSMATLQPEMPSTLQAELRDYQIEGFTWLARLAHWGVGACLADDMGLGKTLQALALILTRAPQGPTLVVAPTSVATNWISEATKFAPTLNCITLGSGDRAAQVAQLQPFDLLVCSYGLLQQEDVAALLAEVEWQTIVLDEAQAIKNSATKRSQAAMKLQGGFKLLTTGTPIENHLGELWNLFRFINPGLLGSAERFNQNFATPIERHQDKAARQKLKKLIQPFILRRTKSQVLAELPSRTEVTLQVELSAEERTLYEALRREALAKLTESDFDAGAKHLQVLAEIMRLRRACCNPRLVMPDDVSLPSAKLEVLGEVLTELLANRHKALVFSQFVDHLTLIREYLDQQNITYQYLDGSTPAKQRKVRVDAFQAGEGDVFLISLKAGGTGLNLTAADYVIHMDPWWNPAVEDQASDRAHRIGQQRPVTIYRLVAQGTIEEQIVDLHQQKRDLADSLLEGTDVSGKISTDDLLKLIQTI